MKKIQLFIPLTFIVLVIASCKKDFLEKAPGVDLTENSVFLSKPNLESFMATMYKYGMHSTFRYRDQQHYSTTVGVSGTDVVHTTSDITEEGDASEASFISTNTWNSGNVTPGNIVQVEDYRYYTRWIALRQVKLVITRAKEVPANDPTADNAYINQVVAEAKFLRALNYFEMLKRYGGVPIVDTLFSPGVPINVPRSSFDACVKFILKDCDEAYPSLPARYSASQTGRATSIAVLALKAKTLLYAASPQFNTDKPFLSMANPADNKFICYGNSDQSRWATAAIAAKDALAQALSNGYVLINDPALQKNNALTTTGLVNNYRNAWELYAVNNGSLPIPPNTNTELILTYNGWNTTNTGNAPLTFINPTCFGSYWSGVTVPLNFLKRYEDTLGNIVTWSTAGGTDLLDMYGKLDRRFKQTMCYTESYYNQSYVSASIFDGGNAYVNCSGGLWLRKYLPGFFGNFVLNDPIFRVNELFLNCAEALNESGATAEAMTYIDIIRIRSGQPPLSSITPQLNQDQLRIRIKNERAIELCFDDQHFWDLRRWLNCDDGLMKGAMDGLKINKLAAPRKYSWVPYTFETRVFNTNMYLHPFPLAEVQKGNLMQNPGWQ